MTVAIDPSEIEDLTASQRYRAMIAIMITAFLAGIAMGSGMPMISVAMEIRGESPVAIGWVVAAAPIALLATTPFINTVVDRLGMLNAMLISAAVSAINFCLLPYLFDPVAWFVLRFISGVGIAVLWVLGEVWINAVATTANRGRVIMVYTLLLTLGFLVGPGLTQYFGVDSWAPFYVAGALLGVSVLPLWIARDSTPRLPPGAKHAFVTSFRTAPLIMLVMLVGGFIDATQISFLPVYAVHMGRAPEAGLAMLMVLIGGSCIFLIVSGWLADRMNRRTLLLACLTCTCAMSAALPFALKWDVFLWPVLALWGGATFSMYSVALMIIGDRFPGARLAGASAALVAMFEIGSVSGPVTVGYAIDLFGPNGMPVVLVAICLPLFILALVRRGRHRPVSQEVPQP